MNDIRKEENEVMQEALALVPLDGFTFGPMSQEAFQSLPIGDLNSLEAKKKIAWLKRKEKVLEQAEINEWIFSVLEKEYFYRFATVTNKQQLKALGRTIYGLVSTFADLKNLREMEGTPNDDFKVRMRKIYAPPAMIKQWRKEDKYFAKLFSQARSS